MKGNFLCNLFPKKSSKKRKPDLVNLEEWKRLFSTVDLGDSKNNEYIIACWLKYVEWWDSRSGNAKRKYHNLRTAVVIGSALIPAIVGLRELTIWKDNGWVFAIASVVASLVVAICAGLETLGNYGGIWREKRAAAELIKSEGFRFLTLIADYKNFGSHKEAFKTFAENVDKLIRNEIEDYIQAVSPKNQNNSDPKKSWWFRK